MKLIKLAFFIWSGLITFLIVFAFFSNKTNNQVESHVFCAYNRVFVEFDENGKRWGTIMLDYQGKAIPCSEDEVEPEKISSKGITI